MSERMTSEMCCFFSSDLSMSSSVPNSRRGSPEEPGFYFLSLSTCEKRDSLFQDCSKIVGRASIGIDWAMCLGLNQSLWIERNFSECPNMAYMKPGVELDPLLNCVS